MPARGGQNPLLEEMEETDALFQIKCCGAAIFCDCFVTLCNKPLLQGLQRHLWALEPFIVLPPGYKVTGGQGPAEQISLKFITTGGR